MHNNGTVEKPTTTASEERLEWPETGRNSRSMAKAAGAAREMDRHSDRVWPYRSTTELETQSRTETDKDGDGVRNGVMAEQRRQITDDRTTPEGAGQRRNRTTTGRSNQTPTELTAGATKVVEEEQPDNGWNGKTSAGPTMAARKPTTARSRDYRDEERQETTAQQRVGQRRKTATIRRHDDDTEKRWSRR